MGNLLLCMLNLLIVQRNGQFVAALRPFGQISQSDRLQISPLNVGEVDASVYEED